MGYCVKQNSPRFVAFPLTGLKIFYPNLLGVHQLSGGGAGANMMNLT